MIQRGETKVECAKGWGVRTQTSKGLVIEAANFLCAHISPPKRGCIPCSCVAVFLGPACMLSRALFWLPAVLLLLASLAPPLVDSFRLLRQDRGYQACISRRSRMVMTSTGSAGTAKDPSAAGPLVLGLGVCGVDLLAYVAKFPSPDDKIRTTDFKVQGGGNAGNTLTGLARLGVRASIITKVGDDAYGRMITSELEGDGVDTSMVVVKGGKTSPFTYVLVDTETLTRTCIHTPSEDVLEEEISEQFLEGVSLLHLDSRNTKAAVKLAGMSKAMGIPVVIDAEKDRPYLRDLIPYATYICTNTAFPKTFTDSDTVEEGMVSLLNCGGARFVTTTLGSEGSMLMCRSGDLPLTSEEGEGAVNALPVPITISKYVHPRTQEEYDVVVCGVWPIKAEEIVDTTGAGDAFISGIIYGVLHGFSAAKMLSLSSFVAASKLKGPGARAGLPKREAVPPQLLL